MEASVESTLKYEMKRTRKNLLKKLQSNYELSWQEAMIQSVNSRLKMTYNETVSAEL